MAQLFESPAGFSMEERHTMADAQDIVLVIGDVGVETIYREHMLWTGAGGSALNLADTLCDAYNIRTLLVTKADPVLGWQVKDAMERFHKLNGAIALMRTYEESGPGSLYEVNHRYAGLDISTHLAIVMDGVVESVYSGRDINLSEHTASLRNAIDACVLVVAGTRLTEETFHVIAALCQELSQRLIVVRNGREQSLAKFAGIGNGGGCHLLVLGPRDASLFGQRDSCEVAGARLVAYVNPEARSWSFHGPGGDEVLRGQARFEEGEEMMDTVGALEGFTAGYIAATHFDGYILGSRQATDMMNEGLKRALRLTGGNTLSLRDPDDPQLNVTGL